MIVTALGIKEDRKKLSYSAQSIGGQELQETQRDNVVMGLQGRVAGLSLTPTSGIPGSAVNITLRGVNSIGNNKPAYRVRPRYNSEYVWNLETLNTLGGADLDYPTKERWFSKP